MRIDEVKGGDDEASRAFRTLGFARAKGLIRGLTRRPTRPLRSQSTACHGQDFPYRDPFVNGSPTPHSVGRLLR